MPLLVWSRCTTSTRSGHVTSCLCPTTISHHCTTSLPSHLMHSGHGGHWAHPRAPTTKWETDAPLSTVPEVRPPPLPAVHAYTPCQCHLTTHPAVHPLEQMPTHPATSPCRCCHVSTLPQTSSMLPRHTATDKSDATTSVHHQIRLSMSALTSYLHSQL
jgi:hypothetical protein